MDGKDLALIIIDQLDEMLEQTRSPDILPLVTGIELYPYIVGQPYRLRYLRRALQHLAAARDRGGIWMTATGSIYRQVAQMAVISG